MGLLKVLLHCRLRRRLLRRVRPRWMSWSVRVAAWYLVMPPLAEQEHQAQSKQRDDSHSPNSSPNDGPDWSR